MKKRLKIVRSRSHDILRTLRLVWGIAPFWTAANTALVILQGLLPLAALYVMKQLVDAVTTGIESRADDAMGGLTVWIVAAGVVALLMLLCRSLAEIVNEAQSHYVTEHMSDLIHRQSVLLDLAHYENAAYHDAMERAQQEAPHRPLAILNTMTQVAQAAVSVFGIAGLLFAFNAAMTLFLLLCALPWAVCRLLFARKWRDLEVRQTQRKRLAHFCHIFLTLEYPAKELKLFNLGDAFRQKYRALKTVLRTEKTGLLRRRALLDFLGQGLATVALFACLWHIAMSALRGAITLGAMVMYYQAFRTGMTQLQSLLRNAAQLFEHSLFLEHFFEFLEMKPAIVAQPPFLSVPARPVQGLRLENVSFRYPGRDTDAVKHVDLRIAPGQVIALVGANGSGKSTIAKLLPRLYDPSDGRITVDGIDLRNVVPEEWRRQVSVVFQDFLRYPMSARDNIRFGDLQRSASLEALRESARASGADSLISRLPFGYDTVLGNAYNNGHELSTGEWQKLAVARAFFREASLVILDEPSSALDPLAELDLFNRFRALVEGKSAVLISHRFSTVQMADYIYVLDEGSVIEQGTHRELLGLDGMYARFYFAQAERFQEVRASAT